MNYKKERKEFADARPLPPFGRVVRWFVEILQLKNPNSYVRSSRELSLALRKLDKRTADTVFAGEMVTEDSKIEISHALAHCLTVHPSLPFQNVSQDDLAGAIRNFWAAYERVSCRLTSFPAARDVFLRVFVRHATGEFAIRAGALAWLYSDRQANEDVPVWSSDQVFKNFLRDALQASLGSRDEAAIKLSERARENSPGQSEVDRWLDKLDVPAPNHIRNWDEFLAASSSSQNSAAVRNQLWRLYVGRRIWNSLSELIPADMREELLSAYCRIKLGVFAYLALEERASEEKRRQQAAALAVVGSITDPLMAHQILRGQSDVLWRSHVEALLRVERAPTRGLPELCQTWAAIAGIYEDVPLARRPTNLDEFARVYFLKAERGGDPSAEYAKLLEVAIRYQSNGDLDKADAVVQRLVELAPFAAGPWDFLATIRRQQNRPDEAEQCYRTALQLEPHEVMIRGKLVSLLDSRGRLDEANAILFDCPPEHRDSPDWLFAHGKLLLKQGRHSEAKEELLKCVKHGFLLGICYQLLAVAAAWLGQFDEKREYEKRAKELEAVLPQRRN